ncbi:protein rfbJ [Escherichia coli]|uniref:glycosyltransferase n=1 Tax=Escherichia coli TaxID=562 RepID=UPI00191A2E0C|nr:glycosyltransferase [Escherichia coli]UMS58832.1 protein rfbJ [Escherichia coli]CAD5723114.1 putative glucosyl-3-phosphoglycerate synthase [Escherichia coli]
MYHSFNIAVIIPCYNEQKAIAKVINDFKTNIPTASIYVFDNNSTDSTAQVAEDAGATVHSVPLKGTVSYTQIPTRGFVMSVSLL